MRLFGWELSRTKAAPPGLVPPLTYGGLNGWHWPTIQEPFTGAWQRNMEITQETSMRNHAVYSCVTLIAQDISKIRIKLVEQDPRTRVWEEVVVPAFSPVLRKPNRYQNRIQFLECWMYSLLTFGNTYVLKERDNRGVVTDLYVLDPARVRVLLAPDGAIYYQLYADSLTGIQEDSQVVPAEDIIHDRMSTIFHPLVGVSPLTACALPALQSLEAQKQQIETSRNQAVPSGLLIAPAAISQETADRIKAKWQANYSGGNVGRVAILGDGMKFERMAMSPVDAQLIEHLQWSAEAICSAFHIPAFKVTQVAPAYNNIEALNQEYFSQCLQYFIESIELCLDEGLGLVDVPGHIYGVEFDVDDGLLRMDTNTKVITIGLGVQRGIFSPNEARARFDLPPVKGGEEPFLQQQNFPIDMLSERPAPTAPVAQIAPPKPDNSSQANDNQSGGSDPAQQRDIGYIDEIQKALIAWKMTGALRKGAELLPGG